MLIVITTNQIITIDLKENYSTTVIESKGAELNQSIILQNTSENIIICKNEVILLILLFFY